MAEEIKLLQAAMDGNPAAFEQIVKKYQSLVCAITFSGTGRVDTSEELAQETFLNAWKNLRQLKELTGFRAWLCTIARNILKNYYRRKKTIPLDPAHLAGISDQTQDPSDNLITQEEHVMLEQALMQIPAEYREPLVMYYRQEKSTKEVAAGLELNESTVRTRLHRARQMLREEIAARLERTLEKTAPDKTFTRAVMAGIGAGLAAGAAGTASAAAATGTAGAGTTASTGIAAVMSTVTAKVMTAAAVAAILVGGVFAYKHLSQPDQPSIQFDETFAAVDERKQIVAPETAVIETPETQEVAVNPIDVPKIQPVVSKLENTDSSEPIAPESVECVHAFMKENDQEAEIWTKGDKKWRVKAGDIEKICDGKRILVLDHRNKQTSYSQEGLKQPEEVLQPLMVAELVSKNFDPAKEEISINMPGGSCIVRINPDIEPEPGEVVFDAVRPETNELLGTVWVDKQTGKLNYLEATESEGGLIGEWHYEPLDDELFSTKVPAGYELEKGRYINGIVTDADSNPVTDATVYVSGRFEGPAREIVAQTNKEGFFEYELKFDRDDWGIEFPVVIRAVSPSYPDRVAWTCILDPDMEVERWPEWMPPIDPEVVVTKLESRKKKAICKSIQALWLQMEPAGSMSGIVTNKQGETIEGAGVTAHMWLRFYVTKQRRGKQIFPRFAISAGTDEHGYYQITGIPSLEGDMFSSDGTSSKSCYVTAAASGYFEKSQYIQNTNKSGNTDVTFTEEKYCDHVLSRNGLTIKGRVIDNYGNPLAHYDGVRCIEKGSSSSFGSARLDAEGRFVIPNAPRADVIVIKKDTLNDSSDWLRDNETKDLEFMPYPEKTLEFNIPADVNVLDVGDLVMDYPDITAEIFVVDFEGNPIGFVQCAFEQMVSKEMLKYRYRKVTDEKEGKCVIENLPRAESGGINRAFRPMSLRPSEKAPKKYRKILEQYPSLTYYHLKYPGDYKHYIFELVLPRDDHRQDYRMRVFSPDGELLLEKD